MNVMFRNWWLTCSVCIKLIIIKFFFTESCNESKGNIQGLNCY